IHALGAKALTRRRSRSRTTFFWKRKQFRRCSEGPLKMTVEDVPSQVGKRMSEVPSRIVRISDSPAKASGSRRPASPRRGERVDTVGEPRSSSSGWPSVTYHDQFESGVKNLA